MGINLILLEPTLREERATLVSHGNAFDAGIRALEVTVPYVGRGLSQCRARSRRLVQALIRRQAVAWRGWSAVPVAQARAVATANALPQEPGVFAGTRRQAESRKIVTMVPRQNQVCPTRLGLHSTLQEQS